MKLSVVIPNYNHGHLLHRCVGALSEQSRIPDEVIIVDDASTDGSRDAIRQLSAACPLRTILLGENRGPSHAMNLAMEQCDGDCLFFLAADDLVAPQFIEKSLFQMAAHPRAGLCCTESIWRELGTGLSWKMGLGKRQKSGFVAPEELEWIEKRGKSFIPTSSAVFRRDALVEIGGFKEALRCSSDWYACYVTAFQRGVCYVNEPLTNFNICFDSYYHRIRRDPKAFRPIVTAVLESLLACPQRNAVERLRRSGALHRFGWPMLSEILSNRRYTRFLTLPFLRLAFLHCVRLALKPRIPRTVANLYLKYSDYANSPYKTVPSHL